MDLQFTQEELDQILKLREANALKLSYSALSESP